MCEFNPNWYIIWFTQLLFRTLLEIWAKLVCYVNRKGVLKSLLGSFLFNNMEATVSIILHFLWQRICTPSIHRTVIIILLDELMR